MNLTIEYLDMMWVIFKYMYICMGPPVSLHSHDPVQPYCHVLIHAIYNLTFYALCG